MHDNMYNLIIIPFISFRSLMFYYILKKKNTSISFEEGSKYIVHYNLLCSVHSTLSGSHFTFMLQYRKLKPKWYINLKCFNQARITGPFFMFNHIAWETGWTEQKVQMFESNSYHKEWRSREGLWKISSASLFVPQIADLKKCNLM